VAVDETTWKISAVLFLATLVRSAFGFGEALVAVPLLALLMVPVEVAVPLATLMSITVAAAVLVQDWHHVHLGSAWRLVLPTLLGIPLGVWLLTAVAEPIIKGILAVFIIAFSLYCLIGPRPPELKGDRLAWPFGFAAGVLGGAYAINGPPLVVYGALRRWSPGHFRATLQGYFLPASLAGLGVYWLRGLWVADVTRYYLLSLAPSLAAVVLGRAINRRLKGRGFLVCVHLGLIGVGAMLLTQSLGR
jgi:uncharacterized membrane protein YfcA